ncbi:MAG: DUF433 domain-containing protein [bacterium]|nr:DUF433 domain-containing protein [bacterium]
MNAVGRHYYAGLVPAVVTPDASTGDSYLGRGIYDVAEVARLLRKTRQRVEGWTRSGPGANPLLTGELAGLFSFWDLMSLRVIAVLLDRGVERDHIRTGAGYLAGQLGTRRPFAHKSLATMGVGFFAEIEPGDGWENVGQAAQLAFQQVVLPLLEPIEYDEEDMAAIWRPSAGVWINPAVQAGEPCVDGTRVPTGLIARLLTEDEDEEPSDDDMAEVSGDYQISVVQVRAALEFELTLASTN